MVATKNRQALAVVYLVLASTLVAGFIPFYIFTTASLLSGHATGALLLFVLVYGALAVTALVLSLVDLIKYRRRRPLPMLGFALSAVSVILLGGLLVRLLLG